MSMKNWVLKKLIGGKADTAYKAAINFGSGYRTYLSGLILVVQGIVTLIDASEGTNVGDLLDLLRDPAMAQIAEGFGLMALRKSVDGITGAIRG